MPLINESLKYSKENPSRDDKPRILGLQKNGGCFFPSYHAQKQNLAESETKDFDLVPTIASTGGSKKERKENTGLHLLALLRTKTLLGTLGRESHPPYAQGNQPLWSQPPKDQVQGQIFLP